MILVPANMARFGFSPCKKKLFLVPAKYFGFEISPWKGLISKGLISKPKYFAGTFLKIKRFCRDYFPHKWVQSSCVTCANHHKSGARDQNQNETYL